MANANYYFNDVIVTFTSALLAGGQLNINNLVRNGGMGEGNDTITVTYEGKTTKTVGADGSVQMNINTNDSGTLTFKFLYISSVNNILTDFLELTKGNGVSFNISILNRKNGRLYNYLDCSIESLPDMSIGTAAESWTWSVLFSSHAVVTL